MNRKNNPWVSLVALLLLVVILALACTGCYGNTKTAYGDQDDAPKTMTVVDSTNGYAIYRHDVTGVHYLCIKGYGKSVCVMLNADGTPYTGAEVQG